MGEIRIFMDFNHEIVKPTIWGYHHDYGHLHMGIKFRQELSAHIILPGNDQAYFHLKNDELDDRSDGKMTNRRCI